MLLLVPRKTPAEITMVIIIFITLVLAHGLFSFAVLPGLLLLALYRKEARFVALFVVIFSAWYLYQATIALDLNLKDWWLHPMKNIFEVTTAERYQVAASTARLVIRYSQLIYVALYAALVCGGIVLLLRRRDAAQHRNQVISCLLWAIGTALTVFGSYGAVLGRAYMFCLVPAVCITVLSFASRRVMTVVIVALICFLPVLSLLNNYGGEASFSEVRTTELKGAQFFATKVVPESEYFYQFNPFLILHYNPDLYSVPAYGLVSFAEWPGGLNISVLDRFHYVVLTKQGSDSAIFAWGEDPYSAWPQTETGKTANLIYNNGYFQIYENQLTK
jgi:hypothetical protein